MDLTYVPRPGAATADHVLPLRGTVTAPTRHPQPPHPYHHTNPAIDLLKIRAARSGRSRMEPAGWRGTRGARKKAPKPEGTLMPIPYQSNPPPRAMFRCVDPSSTPEREASLPPASMHSALTLERGSPAHAGWYPCPSLTVFTPSPQAWLGQHGLQPQPQGLDARQGQALWLACHVCRRVSASGEPTLTPSGQFRLKGAI